MDKEIPKSERRKRRAAKWGRYAVVAVCVAGAGLWLLRGGEPRADERSLTFATADTGPVESAVSASGKVVAAYEEVINSPISSRILKVYHHKGDVVEAGTPLLLLDLAEAQTACDKLADRIRMKELEISQAMCENASKVSQLEMQIKVGEMRRRQLEVELINERYLDSIGSGTSDKVREAEFALRSKELEQEQLRQQLEALRNSAESSRLSMTLESEILAKESEMARRTLESAEVRSPRRATVTQIQDRTGSSVSAGQQLALLSDLGHFKLECEAPDFYAPRITEGAYAKVKIPRIKNALTGRVSEVSPGSVNGMTSFSVLLDTDSLPELRPGLLADVAVSQGLRTDITRIPVGPYYTRPGKQHMFVRRGDKLVRVEVAFGDADIDYVEVKSGLSPGDEVVTSPMEAYMDHEYVRISK